MAFLSDAEKEAVSISRMIFHVVGKSPDDLILLNEISPPQFEDFFVERVKSALRGNLFEFRDPSKVERLVREMATDATVFAANTQALASEFQNQHNSVTSAGVFFVFELNVGGAEPIYALIKYDNEDVVRYLLQASSSPQVPRLERFHETFVRKPEAMQKIALVRLSPGRGGSIMVRDRSNTAHISDYFERFLQARRVNLPGDLSEKLAEAFKETFKDHRTSLPDDIQRNGVNRIYDVFRQGGHRFDPEACEPLITAIFGQVSADSPLRRTLARKLRDHGVSEETFEIHPESVRRPSRRRIETEEGTQILFDEDNRPVIRPHGDGRQEIVVVTSGVTRDDVDIEKRPRGG